MWPGARFHVNLASLSMVLQHAQGSADRDGTCGGDAQGVVGRGLLGIFMGRR